MYTFVCLFVVCLFRIIGKWQCITHRFCTVRINCEDQTVVFLSTPEKPAAINFAFYKSRLANPALVDEFEQKFNAVKIPEPMDTYTAGLDEAQKKAQADVQKFITDSNARIKKYEEQASVYKSLPPTDLMTYDDVFAAFPEMKPDKEKYPIWPHKPIE
ncbi:ATP5H [Branchiostoma lanceolatum]|uniref:ATP5H protein n=1 Tax=Branchiostoma lanceolatum TaxID=7740 RepID=A0A8K0F0S6_BRALA|nr:ATP5H [Branchiostoma lanceolatum]